MSALYAKLVLLGYVCLHFIRRPFRWRRNGLSQFMDHYRGEGLSPMGMVDRDWQFQFSRCLNCGICDAVCPAHWKLGPDLFPGPSYLVTTFTRSLTDLWAVNLDFSLCESCEGCQKICPNQVPVKEALEFIEAKIH